MQETDLSTKGHAISFGRFLFRSRQAHPIDRIALFLLLFALASFLFTQEGFFGSDTCLRYCHNYFYGILSDYVEFFDTMSMVWLGLMTTTVVWLVFVPIKSPRFIVPFLVLGLICITTLWFVGFENYIGEHLVWLPRDYEDPNYAVIWALSVGLSTLFVGKFGLTFLKSHFAKTHLATRVRCLTLIALGILLLNTFCILGVGTAVTSLIDSEFTFLIVMPFVMLLAVAAALRFSKTRIKFLSVLAAFLIGISLFIHFVGQPIGDVFHIELCYYGVVLWGQFFYFAAVLVGILILPPIRKYDEEMLESVPPAWRINVFNLGMVSSVAGVLVAMIVLFDPHFLYHAENSGRWWLARQVRLLHRETNPKLTFEFIEAKGEKAFDGEFEVNCTIGKNDSTDCLKNIPDGLPGEMTIRGIRPNIDTACLQQGGFDFVFKRGEMTLEQISSIPPSKYRPLITESEIPRAKRPTWEFFDNVHIKRNEKPDRLEPHQNNSIANDDKELELALQIQFDTQEITSSWLDALSNQTVILRGLTGEINHELTRKQWEQLAKLGGNSKAGTELDSRSSSPFISLDILPGDLEAHRSSFRNAPESTANNQFLLHMWADKNDPKLFKADQFRLMLRSNFNILTYIDGEVAPEHFELLWKTIIGSKNVGFHTFGINLEVLSKELSDSDFSKAESYGWVYKTDETKSGLAVVLPVVTHSILDSLRRRHPDLESLTLGPDWLPSGVESSTIESRHLEMLGSFQHLKRLNIGFHFEMEDLSWLKNLKQLEHLEFFPKFSFEDLDYDFPAAECPNLKTVVTYSFSSGELVDAILKLPNLGQIVFVDDQENIDDWKSKTQNWEELQQKALFKVDSSLKLLPNEDFEKHLAAINKELRHKYLCEE